MAPLLTVLVLCVVALLAYLGRHSGRLRITQTRLIPAPAAAVHALVADLRRWPEWCPWIEQPAGAGFTLTGRAGAPDGGCAWDGPSSGCGQVVHLELAAPDRIVQRMDFRRPFRFRGRGEWSFVDGPGGTTVSWRLRGRVGLAMRAFAPTVQAATAFDFRYGLDRLACLLEAGPGPRYAIEYAGQREVAALAYLYLVHEGPIDGLDAAARQGLAAARDELAALGREPAGDALVVYLRTNLRQRRSACRMGWPVDGPPGGGAGARLQHAELPAHRAFVVRLRGGREQLELAWYLAMRRLAAEGMQPDTSVAPFERWLPDARQDEATHALTELHLPVRPAPAPAASADSLRDRTTTQSTHPHPQEHR